MINDITPKMLREMLLAAIARNLDNQVVNGAPVETAPHIEPEHVETRQRRRKQQRQERKNEPRTS
jgi:hypothetical protein